jgi:NAD+ kinase
MTSSFPVVGVVAKRDAAAATLAGELAEWLVRRGHLVRLDAATLAALGRSDLATLEAGGACDLVIVLGGDGTILSVARRYAGGPPILGVNLGYLGYLTEVPREDLYPALVEVLSGAYALESRSLLEVRLERAAGGAADYLALNDAVIAKTAPSRIIEFDVEVDGKFVSRYRADGLVVSTPTGSTAYNLSAGGPILHPQLPVTVLTPICPHTLTLRPLVVPDTSVLAIRLETDSESVFLTVDGQEGTELAAGDRVRLRRHDRPVLLLRTAAPRSIFEGLRSKLHWGE